MRMSVARPTTDNKSETTSRFGNDHLTTKALNQLEQYAGSTLNESDIFKLCVKQLDAT